MVAMKLPANNVDGGTTACLKKLKNAVSTNNPTIHPRKNEKGTDEINQTFHPTILFLFGRSIQKRVRVRVLIPAWWLVKKLERREDEHN